MAKPLKQVICDANLAVSFAEARRQVSQGAIYVNGKRASNADKQVADSARVELKRHGAFNEINLDL